MACGMISLQFMAWIGSDFGPPIFGINAVACA